MAADSAGKRKEREEDGPGHPSRPSAPPGLEAPQLPEGTPLPETPNPWGAVRRRPSQARTRGGASRSPVAARPKGSAPPSPAASAGNGDEQSGKRQRSEVAVRAILDRTLPDVALDARARQDIHLHRHH